ncbi:hypothetical protein IBX65_06340 [Candidatus Aerophobetes bacterium]|nr:hypothetical protein [Candidatus Aerophobetes bacterium]
MMAAVPAHSELSNAPGAILPPHNYPGPAAERVLFRAFDVDRAPRDLEAGRMDIYMFSLKTAAAQRMRHDVRFNLFEAPATTLSLLLNPAPAPPGELNPFSIREVRQAVQYLVDREFIVRDIYQGMALPMVSHVSPQEFDFLTVYDIDRGSGISYDPELGRELIAGAMERAGATLIDGIWHYGKEPVRLKLIARVEDERREIANLVRTEMEKAGFMVAISYRPFAAAVLTVYSTDPKAFEWHLYTEGWGRAAPQRYDFATINQMNAPWLGNMPGWQEVGFWQYQHPELDELGKRLFRGEFTSLKERSDIYRLMSKLGLEESMRIWLVTAINSFPAQKNLVGVTRDLVAGPRSPWTLREAHVPGRNEVIVGHLWVWTERTTWNPVGGFGDVYSVDIWRSLHDSPMWNHPFTGIPRSFRVDFQVETAGPKEKLIVPSDAVIWNAHTNKWDAVEAGTKATSKVIFDYSRYFQSSWHHGEAISMADVLYSIVQSYELAYDADKSRIEVALGVTTRPYLETFRGYRLLDDKRLEVYVDFWHFEESYIASYASPASLSMPWEILAAMDDLVFSQRRAAYSDTAAARFNVPWLNLVMDRDARLVRRTLRQFLSEGSIPGEVFQIGNDSLVSLELAMKRYQAAINWFDKYGHLVISNGPFFLFSYDPPAQFAELRAFRDDTYPYRPGDWFFGEPPTMRIERVETHPVSPGEKISLNVVVHGPGTLGLRYLFLDPVSDEVLKIEEAEPVLPEGKFTILFDEEFTSKLKPGFYHLYLAAYSDSVAFVVEQKVDVDVVP